MVFLIHTELWCTVNHTSGLVSHHFLRLCRQTLGQYLELYYVCFLPRHSYVFTNGHYIQPYITRAADARLTRSIPLVHKYIQDNPQLSFNLPLLLIILFFIYFLHFVPQLNCSSPSDIRVASGVRQDRSRSDTDRPNTATFTKQNSPNMFRRTAEDKSQLLERTKSFY